MLPTQHLKAVLVGLHLPGTTLEDHQASLQELGRLANTLGYEVLTTISQKRSAAITSTIIGEGKLEELARWTRTLETDVEEGGSPKADLVIFDDELTPTQLKNLETATGVEVLDRTGVIIEIFHRHAKTREARIQVEIARLKYLSPRLRLTRMGQQDRQGGGGGASGKGLGETAHELDKRRIRDRISELKQELEEIHGNQIVRRQRREEQLKVALIGYTNAGKSSLMRALTGSQVLVENKLFATLDTTVRAMHPDAIPRVLVSDTVGFIKKLPHDLVASFRSTLDEASDASLLLYVVDASDPTFRSQLKVTQDVLAELDLHDVASLLILNKRDCLEAEDERHLLHEFPGSIAVSTKRPEDILRLRDTILAHFEKNMLDAELLIPYSDGEWVGKIHNTMRVLKQFSSEEGMHFTVRSFPEILGNCPYHKK